jgi:hypothetical protein
VYEPVIDRNIADNSRDAGRESELTPIFHALSRRATDPVECFRRDPLRAPLPAGAALPAQPPAMSRMLLSAVPANQGARQAARHRVAAHRDRAVPTDPPAGTQCAQEAHGHRGGRHRALRAVERGPRGL